MLLILFVLANESFSAFKSIGFTSFFTDSAWFPEPRAADGEFGLWQMIAGTTATCSLAVLFATPLGVLSVVFNQFYAPRILGLIVNRLIELLAGIPSVVLGLWGLVVLVPVIQRIQSPGVSVLAAAIVLALMILPTITLSSRNAVEQAVKQSGKAAAALGLGKAACITRIFLPQAGRSILVGVLLAAARAIGETMVVVMLCGNVLRMPTSAFDSTRTLTATIALEMGYSFGAHRASLFAIGLLLMSSVLATLFLIRVLSKGPSRNAVI